ncbi:MAG: arginase [Armatimonadetes bacterium]|nr:arginase [Armatimonadota bacterium]
MVETIAVPFDFCGPHHGSRLGSLAMQLEGLGPSLAQIGVESVHTEVHTLDGRLPGPRAECDDEALRVYGATRDHVAATIRKGSVPLVIGGDHSIAIGSVAGALDVFGERLALLWIDAHMDVNTPDTTPSGNLHGMSVAALAKLLPVRSIGEPTPETKPWERSVYDLWPKLLDVVPGSGLARDKAAWIGLRDVDPGEVANLAKMPGSATWTMQDVDSIGIKATVEALDRWLTASSAEALWVSFDVDVLDPIYAPGTGTAVRGGLSYREGHFLAESLCRLLGRDDSPYRLAGLDVVEVNPLRDNKNETARIAVEWVQSLFGKTILHGAHPGRTEATV